MLYANMKRYTFYIERVVFLGFVVNAKGMKMDEENVKAI